MRRLFLVAVLALGLAACGGSGGSKSPLQITFGTAGGSMMPSSVTIAPGGAVTKSTNPAAPASITSAEDAKLSALVRAALPGLKSEQCPGTFPDESAFFITALGKTITVRGTCEPAFSKTWDALGAALGLIHSQAVR